jgi:hypothetical protein
MSDAKNDSHLERLESQESKSDSQAKETDVSAATEFITTQAEVSSEIADLGIEDGESFGEDENQSKGKQSGGGKKQEEAAAIKTHIHPLPDPIVMRKEVADEIRKEIRKDEKKILLAYIGVKKISPHKLAELVARIRNLKDILASIISASKEALMSLYLKWVKREV